MKAVVDIGLKLVDRALALLLVIRHHLGHVFGQLLLAVGWRRVGAEKLGRTLAADFCHFLPQGDGGLRVVARFGGQLDADLIRFGFRRPAVGLLDGQCGRQGSETFDEKEKITIRFADIVTRGAAAVDADVLGYVGRYYSEDEIVELTMVIGLANLVNRINDTLKIEPDLGEAE